MYAVFSFPIYSKGSHLLYPSLSYNAFDIKELNKLFAHLKWVQQQRFYKSNQHDTTNHLSFGIIYTISNHTNKALLNKKFLTRIINWVSSLLWINPSIQTCGYLISKTTFPVDFRARIYSKASAHFSRGKFADTCGDMRLISCILITSSTACLQTPKILLSANWLVGFANKKVVIFILW